MAPQGWKVPISIVAVNCIDNTYWLDIMAHDLKFLTTYRRMCWFFLCNSILLISQCMEMTRCLLFHFIYIPHLPNFDQILPLIPIPPSSIPIRHQCSFTFKGVLHLWALFLKTLCIFSKNKATSDNVSYGSGQKCSKELENYSFTSVETIVVKLQWKMCKNQYFPCFKP